jgi:SAM-dependent methyltransferase
VKLLQEEHMAISEPLNAEARAFDQRIEERVRHGHVPDLRRVQPCDWFFNNPWRRPYLVQMDCGRAFQFALSHARPARLLEICCGVGHMALEFGRHGFDVVGIDVSARCLEVARRLLAENPFRDGFGRVRYIHGDFLSWDAPAGSFDTVCFFGGLHHLEALDDVAAKVHRLLVPGGRVIIQEPARDWVTEANAAVTTVIRLLLGIQQRWYAPMALPKNEQELRARIQDCLVELREGRDPDEAKQSPHDNASGGRPDAGRLARALQGA